MEALSPEFYKSRIVSLDTELEVGETFWIRGIPFYALLLREPHKGEAVTVVDVKGREFRVRLLEITSEGAKAFVFEEQPPTEPPFELWLLQALPDKERMEFIIQKATELGVHVIIPFKSSRSISLEEREAKQPKAHRWPSIILKAAKQCRRAFLPILVPYCSFEEAIKMVGETFCKIMLYEKAKTRLREAIANYQKPSKVAVMVGPEGGWSEEEVNKAMLRGFNPCSLGGRILRTETASLVACALVLFYWNGLG